jgi:hypothetical protein
MEKHGAMPDNQRAEIAALRWDKTLKQDDNAKLKSQIMANHIMDITGLTGSKDRILELLRVVSIRITPHRPNPP